jgi:hypothetical protein
MKVGPKPQSADTYWRMNDEALAEMYLNDAMARSHSGNAFTKHSEGHNLRPPTPKGSGA